MVKFNRKKIANNIYEIFNIRRNYAENLNVIINKQLNKFKKIRIEYKNKLFSNLENKDDLINLFLNELKNKRELDEITKRTNFSINSDEIYIMDKKIISILILVLQVNKNRHY